MRFRRRDPWEPNPAYYGLSEIEFKQLAVYHSEKGRGLLHDPQWETEMGKLQARYNDGIRREGRDPRDG